MHRQGVAYLLWEDLTVILPNFGQGPTKKLLHGLSGYAEPGRIMATMGPSGSRKSTLLDTLASRLSFNVVMTGNILLNGKKRRLDYGIVAYVNQEDTLLGTLTPRETITYSAHLQLPTSMTKEEVNDIVEGTIMEMGLGDCADRLVGNWQLRGISGGEKKRLSIALEILVRPRILFLDEPTTGLDSASAFFVVQALKNISRDGRTVISSIHQPSSEVFALFDDLFLLSCGEYIFWRSKIGSTGMACNKICFFAESGFPCPSRRNPSDHFLRCINSDFDVVTATLKGSQRLRETQKSDYLMNMATAEIKNCLPANISTRVDIEIVKGSQEDWGKQLWTLTWRSFVNMSRDKGYYWSFIVIYIIVAFTIGTLFYDVGTGYTTILARGVCGGFLRFHSSFGTITYYMVFRARFFHYVFLRLNLFGCIHIVKSRMMIVASLVPNFLMGIIIGSWCASNLALPISFIDYRAWGLRGSYKNDMIGLVFDPLIPNGEKLKGEDVITNMFKFSLDHSKWCDLLALYSLILKERATQYLRSLYAKKTMHQLKRHLSFNRKPFLSYS
ncbi:unnamed protein product [Withania somnifera]